jgi:hypothetical protein
MPAARAGLECALQHEQYRRRRHVAVLPQHVPGMLKLLAFEAKHLLHGFEHLAAARMEQETVEFGKAETMTVQEFVQGRRQQLAHEGRQFRAQDDAEAVILDVPPHDVLGLVPAVLADRENAGTTPGTA